MKRDAGEHQMKLDIFVQEMTNHNKSQENSLNRGEMNTRGVREEVEEIKISK